MYATAEASTQQAQYRPAPAAPAAPVRALESAFAWRVLEEIDYGMLLVTPGGDLQHANHLARKELERERFMRIQNDHLVGQTPWQTEELTRGIQSAAIGRRQLIVLRHEQEQLHVACVPLFHAFDEGRGAVLLMLGRQAGTQNLSVTFFSRSHSLTPTEEAVLKSLCDGLDVHEIAAAKGVSEYTVRTHVRSLRDKTGINSIRGLIQRVAALPPVVPLSLSALGGYMAPQDA
jgi:DNA-binding CsgD family transcriptional regulator